MGIFGSKKQNESPEQEAKDIANDVFDEKFRKHLRELGDQQFERVINENAALFKQDLDATVEHVNTELKQHLARQLDSQLEEVKRLNDELRGAALRRIDEQFAEYTKTIVAAQDKAVKSLDENSATLAENQKKLTALLEKSVANQDALLASSVDESKKRIEDMREFQDNAIDSLKKSVATLEGQQKNLADALKESIDRQKQLAMEVFQSNMAQIVEHYLLAAVGDQLDLKSQMPGIIKKLEENKQNIVDDMKL